MNLAAGNEASCHADGMTGLRLTGAALRDGSRDDAVATLRCSVDGGPYVMLCTLRGKDRSQVQIHVSFTEDEDVDFRCEGNETVSIVGYRYLAQDDDSVLEFNSDDDDEEVPQLVPVDDVRNVRPASEDEEGTSDAESDLELDSDEELDEIDIEDEGNDGTDLKEGERVGKRGIKGKGGWVLFKDSKDQALFEEVSASEIESDGFDTSTGDDSEEGEE